MAHKIRRHQATKDLSEWWSTPRCSRKRSRIRPTRKADAPSAESWSISQAQPCAAAPELLRLAKRAAIMVGRYAHAHQFKRARRELKFLRTRLGRIIRDIRRKIAGDAALEARFARCSI